MELRINLADREEVATAHTLLAVILQGLPQRSLFEEFKDVQAADDRVPVSVTSQVGNASHTFTGRVDESLAAQVFGTLVQGGIAYNDPPGSDPVAVFGGAPAAPLAPSTSPAPAPSTSAPLPPVATAPTTSTPGPVSSGAGAASVELDSKGLPWDERIHASTKSKLTSGEWKVKRGIPPERVTAVEAELRAALGVTPAPLAPVPPVVPTAPSLPPSAPPAAGVGVSSATVTSSPPVAPVASADPADFTQLMPRISAAVASGVLPPSALNDACVANGLPSIVGLQQNVAYVPLVWASLKQAYPALA